MRNQQKKYCILSPPENIITAIVYVQFYNYANTKIILYFVPFPKKNPKLSARIFVSARSQMHSSHSDDGAIKIMINIPKDLFALVF